MDDDIPVPPEFKNQIGRRYRSPHEGGYVRRRVIVQEFARQLAVKGELLTTAKVARIVRSLDRGHQVNSKTISYDLAVLRQMGKAQKYPNGHKILVKDGEGPRIYASLRDAAKQEGCSKETARKWLMRLGTPNRKGQLWSYYDTPDERPKTNWRPRKPTA